MSTCNTDDSQLIVISLTHEVTGPANARRATKDTCFSISAKEAEEWVEQDYEHRCREAEDPTTVQRRTLASIVEDLNTVERNSARRVRTHVDLRSIGDWELSGEENATGDSVVRTGSLALHGIYLSADPEDHEASWVERLDVQRALAVLSHDERRVLDESFDHGYTQREIAQHLGISQPRVNKIRKAALDKLRDSLARGVIK